MKKDVEQQQRKDLARMYFMQGLTLKEIAEKVGVSRNTVGAWAKAGNWSTYRGANTLTRKELVTKMLTRMDQLIESEKFSPDELCKVASAVEKLDKQTNIVTVIEVFSSYNNWLFSRMKVDPELTPELVKIMNRYQDMFISEVMSKSHVEITGV